MGKPFPKRLKVYRLDVIEIYLGLFKQLLTKLHILFFGSQVRKRYSIKTLLILRVCFVALFRSVRNVVTLGSTLLLVIIGTEILEATFLHQRFVNNLRVVLIEDQFSIGRCDVFSLLELVSVLLRHEQIVIFSRLQGLRPTTMFRITLMLVGNERCL